MTTLTCGDLETRARAYLNEATADFFAQADIFAWLSSGVRDIAQKSLCIRRIIDVDTANATRTVATSCYKVMHVEYIPSSGRSLMLTKIDPLRVGHYPLDGTAPQYWYEFGQTIGIEPLPNATYRLRLYVVDLPKICHTTYPITSFATGWTGSGTGTWTNGTTAAYAGTTGQIGVNTWGTALTDTVNYTFSFTVSGISNCTLKISAGTAESVSISANGYYTFNLTDTGGTGLVFTATMTGATGGVTVDNLYISSEVSVSATANTTELNQMWYHLLVLYVTYNGLLRENRLQAASILESLYNNELVYMRQSIIEQIPDGNTDLQYL